MRGSDEDSAGVFSFTGIDAQAYVEAVSRIPILSTKQEQEFAAQASAGRALVKERESLRATYRDIHAAPEHVQRRLSVVDQTITAGLEAQNLLVFHNLAGAAWAAERSLGNRRSFVGSKRGDDSRALVLRLDRFAQHRLSLEDRIQAANVGLVRAAAEFLPGHGARFIGFANSFVANEIMNAVNVEQLRNGLKPGEARGFVRVMQAREKLYAQGGVAPQIEEVARAAGVGTRGAALAIERSWGVPRTTIEEWALLPASVDASTGGDLAAHEVLADPSADTFAAALAATEGSSLGNAFKECLSAREAAVLELRYGLHDGTQWKHVDIGRHERVVGESGAVSPQRAGQIERAALEKLRAWSDEHGPEQILDNYAYRRPLPADEHGSTPMAKVAPASPPSRTRRLGPTPAGVTLGRRS